MNAQDHYAALLAPLEEEYGPLDPETLTAVVGFTAGGPVSRAQIAAKALYVTVELSLDPQQVRSADMMNFELFTVGEFDEAEAAEILTALGGLGCNAELGHGHTIDMSAITGKKGEIVTLKKFNRMRIAQPAAGMAGLMTRLGLKEETQRAFGLYQVLRGSRKV